MLGYLKQQQKFTLYPPKEFTWPEIKLLKACSDLEIE